MKKILFSLLMTIGVSPVFAQISVGFIGGYSHTYFRSSDQEGQVYTLETATPLPPATKRNFAPKCHTGIMADIHLVKRFYLQPQLLVSRKGEEKELKGIAQYGHEYTITENTSLVYLELPVNLLYKIPLGAGKLALGGGPYVARALYGKYKDHGISKEPVTGNITEDRKQGNIRFRNELPADNVENGEYYYKNHDAGLNFIAGYECKNGLVLNINYSLGLTNVVTNLEWPHLNETRKNAYIGLSAGYLFQLKKKK